MKWHFTVFTLNYTYFWASLRYERPFLTSNKFVKNLKFFPKKSTIRGIHGYIISPVKEKVTA